MTTTCVLAAIQKGGDTKGARFIAKRCEQRRCRHEPTKEPFACILDLIGKTNKHKYMVATQDDLLREKLRRVAGVPLFYLKSGQILFEPPSIATIEKWKEVETLKTLPDKKELERLDKIVPVEKPEPVKKKKTVKGVNPLAVKKRKTKVQPAETFTEKKRKRRRKESENKA